MQFYLFLLFFFFHYQFTFITIAYSINDYNDFNQNYSSINIDLYQCDTNNRKLISTTTTIGTIFNNLENSCTSSCCILNNSSNTCQVTVRSSTNICLGHLCYSGECDHFVLLTNLTDENEVKDSTTIMNTFRSPLSYIPWSSLFNKTQTKWSSWIDESGLSIRHTILIILFIANISLTFMTLIVIIKSIRHASAIANRKSYRYTLL
ncbi:unnamed protein product [Rotaria sordida]|uniref:Uncharacterized protein n=1 Tax=Rotaria sordida TaxID=392033 RepID=A0A814BTI9_9BILA|nr:unnamed protein product [Rotaria sordida]CAF1094162.1 unnamed protein product [Rotaria sordida]